MPGAGKGDARCGPGKGVSQPAQKIVLDHERIYRLTHAGDWAALLALVHAHPQAAAQDALVQRALETFEDAFFAQLDGTALDDARAEAVERLILLHSGGIYPLDEERFAALVVRLVAWHLEQGAEETARQYARFCPDREPCASLVSDGAEATVALETHRVAVEHPDRERVQVTVATPSTGADHATSLFKSPQEADFFRAVRAAFPTFTPYPNVALSSLVDFEALRTRLSPDERAYFFKATVDCVVFDPHDDYRPVYFFELDSRHHDDPTQQERDDWKDRIIASAGHRLYRLRALQPDVTTDDFRRLLRTILREASSDTYATPT